MRKEVRLLKCVRTYDNVFECFYGSVRLVNFVQTRNLDQPSHVVRIELVVDDPFRELIPFILGTAVYADPPFAILILALFEICHDLWDERQLVGKKASKE